MNRLHESEIMQEYPEASPLILDLLLDVRRAILNLVPDCHEEVKWRSISYQKLKPGGAIRGGICQLTPKDDHIEMAFVHGKFLPDPERLLEGSQKYKRSVRIYDAEDVRCSPIRDLVQTSFEFDPYSIERLSPTRALSVTRAMAGHAILTLNVSRHE